jgi:hypothetical protein
VRSATRELPLALSRCSAQVKAAERDLAAHEPYSNPRRAQCRARSAAISGGLAFGLRRRARCEAGDFEQLGGNLCQVIGLVCRE